MGHRPRVSINDRNIALGLLKGGTRAYDVAQITDNLSSATTCTTYRQR